MNSPNVILFLVQSDISMNIIYLRFFVIFNRTDQFYLKTVEILLNKVNDMTKGRTLPAHLTDLYSQ